jgi:hypothetical protein
VHPHRRDAKHQFAALNFARRILEDLASDFPDKNPLSDDFSARTASEMCGKEEQLKLNYSISENGQDAKVSMLTGRTMAQRSTVSASKSYNVQRDFVFEPKIFSELKNAESIVLAYDGVNPLPPSVCYLKPHYLDPNDNYFEQLAKGEL